MNDLMPCGTKINVDGVKREILFTLSAVYAIQKEFNEPIQTTMEKWKDMEDVEAMAYTAKLLEILANDEAARKKKEKKKVEEGHFSRHVTGKNLVRILSIILKEYGISLPDAEEEDPNQESGQRKK